MSTSEEIKVWADRLVEKGMAVLDAERDRSGGDGGRSAEEGYLFDGWRVQVLNLLERVDRRQLFLPGCDNYFCRSGSW